MIRNKKYVYGDESLKLPYHLHFGKEILDRLIEHKDHIALINSDTDEILTYAELAQQTVNVALSLTRIGIGRGDAVGICSEKRMEMMPTILGIFCAGATYVPTDITDAVTNLRRLQIGQPKVIFCSPAAYDQQKSSLDTDGCIKKYIVYGDDKKPDAILYKDFLSETAKVEDFVPTVVDGANDYAVILFSSGTTGLPKGVPWTHYSTLMITYTLTHESFRYTSLLNTREWYYTYGLSYTLGCLQRGAKIVYSPKNDEKHCLEAIAKYKVKVVQCAPTFVNMLIKSPVLDDYDLSSLRVLISASTPVFAEQVVAVKKRLPKLDGVYQLYGMSEAGGPCNELYSPSGPRDGSVGIVVHGFVCKVVDIETREVLGPNQRGEICVQCPAVIKEYLGVENYNHLDEEGFYKTGDVGYYDDEKHFFIVDRVKELIKYNDFAVAPAQLESILLKHPSVREVGVVGAPHPEFGQAPTAFVALQPGYTASDALGEELTEYVNSRLSTRLKLAGGVRFVQSLPRGGGEKLDRRALKLLL